MPTIALMRVCSEKCRKSAPLTEYQDATTPGIVSLHETVGNALIDSEIIAWNALLSHFDCYATKCLKSLKAHMSTGCEESVVSHVVLISPKSPIQLPPEQPPSYGIKDRIYTLRYV